MTRILGLLLLTVTLSLGSCQCSNKPEVGPVEEDESAHMIVPGDDTARASVASAVAAPTVVAPGVPMSPTV